MRARRGVRGGAIRPAWVVGLIAVSGAWAAMDPATGTRSPGGDSRHAAGGPTLEGYDFAAPTARHRLPGRLREISGLAVTPDGRLLGHDDERAVIYEIEPDEGRLIKAFSFGDPPARGDFEGIAVARGRVYLVTSSGRIYEGREGADDDRVLFNTYGTGVGRECEVEGLEYDPARDELLLACKTPRAPTLAGMTAIFRWSFATRETVGEPVALDASELGATFKERTFPASGIVRAPTGDYLLVSSRLAGIAEIARDGRILGVARLSPRLHPQPEGIAILPDGSLVVADEGRDRRAHLARYALRSGDRR